jgi:hypothetical protein
MSGFPHEGSGSVNISTVVNEAVTEITETSETYTAPATFTAPTVFTSSLSALGGLDLSIATTLQNLSVGQTVIVTLANATAGAITIEMTDVAVAGALHMVKKIDATSNAVNLASVTGLIDLNASISLAAQFDAVLLVSDGTNWWIIGQIGTYGVPTQVTATAKPTNITVPTVTGTPQAGNQLVGNAGSWSASPNQPTAYAYQWYQVGASSGNQTPVQTKLVSTGTSANIAVTLAAAPTAGHLLTLNGLEFDNILISSISPGTWVKVGNTATGSGGTLEMWYELSATTATAYTVTLASAPGSNRGEYMITEWPITGATYVSDAIQSNIGPSATPTSSAITPSVGELNIATMVCSSYPINPNNGNGDPSTGWTDVTPFIMAGDATWTGDAYNVTDVAWTTAINSSPLACTWSLAGSSVYSTLTARFLPAGGNNPIAGATSANYTPQTTDVGYQLVLGVEASNSLGTDVAGFILSAATTAVISSGAPLDPYA